MDTQAYISSGIIEAYVMGLASEEEMQILECVQKHNAEVRKAVLEAQKAIEDLVTEQAVAPPIHLKKNIWAAIQKEDAKTTPIIETAKEPVVLSPLPQHIKERKDYFKPFAIAASILILVGVASFVVLFQKQENLNNQIAQLENQKNKEKESFSKLQRKWDITSNPEMKTVILAGVEKHPGTKAIVYIDKSSKQTYLSVENLPACPAGHAYQLWAIVDGKPVDAGMYQPTNDAIQKMYIIDNAQAFAITLEKEGGSKTPTMEQMYVMGAV